MIVQEMNLEIKHWVGKGNTNADTLSRNSVDDAWIAQLEASDSPPPRNFPENDEIATKQRADPDFQVMVAYIKDGNLRMSELAVDHVWCVLPSVGQDLFIDPYSKASQ